MITYEKSIFSFNILLHVNGSSVYKGALQGIISSIILALASWLSQTNQTPNDRTDFESPIEHPYAIGVLVTAISFLIAFRANNAYQRYWDACKDVHSFTSKFLDASMACASFHLQSKQFDPIKPSSFFANQELDTMGLSRDRQRSTPSLTVNKDEYVHNSLKQSQTIRSINRVDILRSKDSRGKKQDLPQSPGKKSTENTKSTDNHQSRMRPLEEYDDSSQDGEESVRVDSSHSRKKRFQEQESNQFSEERLIGTLEVESRSEAADIIYNNFPGMATNLESRGILNNSTRKSGRGAPSLFLQELCHLSSLTVAVAFSTLRNDAEGSSSPLAAYIPGMPWPEVDPRKLSVEEKMEAFGNRFLAAAWLYWLGMNRRPAARTRYNAARPMLVLGGVSDAEIDALQKARGSLAKTTLAWYWLCEFITREHLEGSTGNVGPPIISRIHQFMSDAMIPYNSARKTMFIPFPFVSAQLSSFYILIIVWAIPALMICYISEPWMRYLLTFFTVTCLSGLHEAARELENPFRNAPNDIPLCTMMAQYNEALITMYSGYHPDLYFKKSNYLNKKHALSEHHLSSSSSGVTLNNDTLSKKLEQLEALVAKQSNEIKQLRRETHN